MYWYPLEMQVAARCRLSVPGESEGLSKSVSQACCLNMALGPHDLLYVSDKHFADHNYHNNLFHHQFWSHHPVELRAYTFMHARVSVHVHHADENIDRITPECLMLHGHTQSSHVEEI